MKIKKILLASLLTSVIISSSCWAQNASKCMCGYKIFTNNSKDEYKINFISSNGSKLKINGESIKNTPFILQPYQNASDVCYIYSSTSSSPSLSGTIFLVNQRTQLAYQWPVAQTGPDASSSCPMIQTKGHPTPNMQINSPNSGDLTIGNP